MTQSVLLYSTTDGQTVKIAHKIATIVQQAENELMICPISEAHSVDLKGADQIIIGASIRYGKHKKEVRDFIVQHEALLKSKVTAFYSVNLVARKADRNTEQSNPYVRKFLANIPWKPDKIAVFAGKIDYQHYRFWDRIMIQLIMWMTHGPTNADALIEFTDWKAVERFAQSL